jgi:hypothetical protein
MTRTARAPAPGAPSSWGRTVGSVTCPCASPDRFAGRSSKKADGKALRSTPSSRSRAGIACRDDRSFRGRAVINVSAADRYTLVDHLNLQRHRSPLCPFNLSNGRSALGLETRRSTFASSSRDRALRRARRPFRFGSFGPLFQGLRKWLPVVARPHLAGPSDQNVGQGGGTR